MPEVNIPGVGIVHFPYDMPPDQVAAAAKRLHDEAQQPKAPLMASHEPGAAAAPATSDGPGPIETGIAALGQRGFGALPGGEMGELLSRAVQPKNIATTGGAVGGLVAGPAGAAAGGALGSALGSGMTRAQDALQTGRRTGPTFEELIGDVKRAGTEGVAQGATQAAGGLAARVPGMASQGLARASQAMAGPAGKTARRFLARTGTPVTIGAAMTSPGAFLGTLAATGAANVATSPKALMTASHAVGRIPAGTGQVPANLFRAALLQALGGAETPEGQP